MDRCALFVDAGYLLADGAMAVHGTRHRETVSWDFGGLLQLLGNLGRERTGMPLLRCYWYEATVEGRRSPEHEALADLPGLKLRLGRIRPGRREGVDTEIHRDLMTLARNSAIADAVIVSGDEDLATAIADAQEFGVRVTVVHVAVDGNWTISRVLRQECDDLIEIGSGHLRPYVSLLGGLDQGGGSVAPLSNGHGAGTVPTAIAPLQTGPLSSPPPGSPITGRPAIPTVPTASAGTSSAGTSSTGTNPLPGSSTNPLSGSSTGTNPLPGSSTGTDPLPGSSTGTNPLPGPSTGTNPLPGSSTRSNPLPGGTGSGSGYGGLGDIRGLGTTSLDQPSSGSSGSPSGGSPFTGLTGANGSASSLPQLPASPPMPPMPTPAPGGTPQYGPPSSSGGHTGPQPVSPPPAVPPQGSYGGGQLSPLPAVQQNTPTLSDAVKAAHKEGQDFGESVARDAPALWLEAVLARKPRMPSDLEARLLQGSSLPIDFLLHDEVRHALRRGFWDALERSRR